MFLNPWALFFLIAMGVPLAVHFLTRPKPVVLPISTLRFIREVMQQRRARHRLRDILLLLMRVTAIALIVLALARPQSGQRPAIAADDDTDAVRVVLLDMSQSLSAVDQGTTLFERARAAAAGYLTYRPNLRANLILAAEKPRTVFDQPSQNFDALREELSRAAPRPERLNASRALSVATELLAPQDANDQRRRELVIVSDFQRTSWAQADFSVLPQGVRIQLESVAPKNPLSNLAVSGARLIGHATEQSTGRIEVDVGNWSAAAQAVTVDVQVEGSTRQLRGDCPGGRLTTLTDDFTLPSVGWHVGTARILTAADALADDDTLPFAMEVRPPPRYLLVSRQPANLRPSSSHFLECAMAPDVSSNMTAGNPKVVRSMPDKLDAEMLVTADLVIIDHPGTLNEVAIQTLADAMRRGRPIWYVAAEAADATNLHRLTAAMGQSLRLPVAFVPPPPGQWRRDLFLASTRFDARPFTAIGESAAGLVRSWRVSGGLASRSIPETLADDILATYNDGSASLVLTLADSTSFAVLNADLSNSNLPSQASFVPFVDELMQQLTEPRLLTTAAHSGQSLVIRLPLVSGGASSLEIVQADSAHGETDLGELHDEAGGVIWRWPVVGPPGVYQIRQGKDPMFALAVSVPADESQLECLSADVLQNRLTTGNSVVYHRAAEGDQTRDVSWVWLTVGCLFCLLAELSILLVFRT